MGKEPTVKVFLNVGFLDEFDFISLSKLFEKGYAYSPRFFGYEFNGINYYFGKRYTYHEIPKNEKTRILRTNMKNNNLTHIILCRTGNTKEWHEGDVVIELEGDQMDDIFNSIYTISEIEI